jgi:hypothetical protein
LGSLRFPVWNQLHVYSSEMISVALLSACASGPLSMAAQAADAAMQLQEVGLQGNITLAYRKNCQS